MVQITYKLCITRTHAQPTMILPNEIHMHKHHLHFLEKMN